VKRILYPWKRLNDHVLRSKRKERMQIISLKLE